ncbi:SDR family NAD(P)-dependent oxidoreductase [Micromonospora wenchangensis]|uniref:SDR family NAD(P)-dependent oxidoreductase n=1 Tax=Micromonospora wenchangensis TaxID=1185415 RepID=UPI00381426E7
MAALRDGGADARPLPLEVTDPVSVAAAAEQVEREHGRLDVLVNNAGIVRADGMALPSETTPATLREVFETNVFAVVTVTNAFLPLLLRAPAGRIVNVSSEVGSITAMTDPESSVWPLTSVPYPSSKAALNMVTAMYAKELNGHSGYRSAEQGAEVSVRLATLPADGPTGQLWGHLAADDSYGVLPW